MAIRNVIFDLGGVLMNLHFERSQAAFEKLGSKTFRDQWSLTKQTQLFDQFETGKISAAAFRQGLRKTLQVQADDKAIDAAWGAMLGVIPPERLAYVQGLRPRYRTYLLSNTNELHLAQVGDHLRQSHGQSSLDAYFDHAHYSHILGHRKPTPQSFQTVLNTHNLTAAETLFVDDLQANIDAARAIGIQGIQVPLGADLAVLLGELLKGTS